MKASMVAMAAVLLSGLSACAPRAPETVEHRVELLAPYAQYYAPRTEGPAPLIILLSGCGGLVGIDGPNRIMNDYAEAAAAAGAYAIVVDSFRPRGIDRQTAISRVCSGLRLRGTERAGDLLAAEALAKAHWRRPFTGVVLAGWSHGGWAVMNLLSFRPDAGRVGNLRFSETPGALQPAAVALFYPVLRLPQQSAPAPLVLPRPAPAGHGRARQYGRGGEVLAHHRPGAREPFWCGKCRLPRHDARVR